MFAAVAVITCPMPFFAPNNPAPKLIAAGLMSEKKLNLSIACNFSPPKSSMARNAGKSAFILPLMSTTICRFFPYFKYASDSRAMLVEYFCVFKSLESVTIP